MHKEVYSKSDFVEVGHIAPQFSLIFHGDDNNVLYVTEHDINQKGEIQTGRFVTPETTVEMVNNALHERTSAFEANNTHFIPQHLLVNKSNMTVWYRPASQRTLLFQFGKKQHQLNAQLPALLFRRHSDGLRIFALNSNKRPTLDSELFHAPLMNINGAGNLCLGDAILPNDISGNEQTLIDTENCFFECYSGHINHSRTINIDKPSVSTNDLFNYFVHQEKQKAKKFNNAHLVSANIKLKGVI